MDIRASQTTDNQPLADPLVCHCYQVPESDIRRAIEVYGYESVAEVSGQTCAGRGCTACHVRIRRLLDGESASQGHFTLCDGCGLASVICECRVA